MFHGFLADLLVAFHTAYAAYIVVGLVLILIGVARGWRWVRNPWFRLTHLLAIVIVALEAAFDVPCPLTVWEARLRQAAGQEFSGESFIGRLLHGILFVDASPWMLNTLHIGLGLLVIATFLFAPPRRALLAKKANAA